MNWCPRCQEWVKVLVNQTATEKEEQTATQCRRCGITLSATHRRLGDNKDTGANMLPDLLKAAETVAADYEARLQSDLICPDCGAVKRKEGIHICISDITYR